MIRRLTGALVVMVLAGGCVWTGPALYGDDRAEVPVPPGRYRATVDGDPAEAVVSVEGRGTFVALDGQPPFRVLLVPLAGMGGRRLWIVQAPVDPRGEAVAYGLLERGPDGWTVAPYMPCADPEAIVRRAGGTVEAGPAPRGAGDIGPDERACVFRSPATLEAALRLWLAAHRPEATLVPVPVAAVAPGQPPSPPLR